jgi:hypothetical protein
VRINIRPRSLKGRDHVGDAGVGGRIGLKMIKKTTWSLAQQEIGAFIVRLLG